MKNKLLVIASILVISTNVLAIEHDYFIGEDSESRQTCALEESEEYLADMAANFKQAADDKTDGLQLATETLAKNLHEILYNEKVRNETSDEAMFDYAKAAVCVVRYVVNLQKDKPADQIAKTIANFNQAKLPNTVDQINLNNKTYMNKKKTSEAEDQGNRINNMIYDNRGPIAFLVAIVKK